jgi:hypothetical protein
MITHEELQAAEVHCEMKKHQNMNTGRVKLREKDIEFGKLFAPRPN